MFTFFYQLPYFSKSTINSKVLKCYHDSRHDEISTLEKSIMEHFSHPHVNDLVTDDLDMSLKIKFCPKLNHLNLPTFEPDPASYRHFIYFHIMNASSAINWDLSSIESTLSSYDPLMIPEFMYYTVLPYMRKYVELVPTSSNSEMFENYLGFLKRATHHQIIDFGLPFNNAYTWPQQLLTTTQYGIFYDHFHNTIFYKHIKSYAAIRLDEFTRNVYYKFQPKPPLCQLHGQVVGVQSSFSKRSTNSSFFCYQLDERCVLWYQQYTLSNDDDDSQAIDVREFGIGCLMQTRINIRIIYDIVNRSEQVCRFFHTAGTFTCNMPNCDFHYYFSTHHEILPNGGHLTGVYKNADDGQDLFIGNQNIQLKYRLKKKNADIQNQSTLFSHTQPTMFHARVDTLQQMRSVYLERIDDFTFLVNGVLLVNNVTSEEMLDVRGVSYRRAKKDVTTFINENVSADNQQPGCLETILTRSTNSSKSFHFTHPRWLILSLVLSCFCIYVYYYVTRIK